MKYNTLLIAFFLLVSQWSLGQYAKLKYTNNINAITRENLLSDMDAYSKGVASNHVDPFTQIKKRAFFDAVQKIKDSADKYDIDQLLIQLLQVNAMIDDEHTNILYTGRDIFPLQCYWFEEGIYITRTDADNLNLLFSKIIAINNIPVEEVIHRITTLVPNKNLASIKSRLPRYLFDPFVLHGLQISPYRDSATYTLIHPHGDTFIVSPQAVDRRTAHMLQGFDRTTFLRTSKDADHWFQYIDSNRCIYFYYASCYDNKEHPIKNVLQDLDRTIKEKKPDKIVIDLRDNSGGYARLLWPFIDNLSTTSLNKKGHIYVLVGRKTFSAAILNTEMFKTYTHAKVVGEETSGSVVHFGAIEYFMLPATHLRVQYSTRYIATDEKYDGSLRPDINIPEKFSDYSKGIDAALKYAFTH